jgi:hypothetical protein
VAVASDLRSWIATEHASVLTRFEQSIGAHVPRERWTDPAGKGGSSIAWLVFHSTLHADVAVNSVLRGGPPVVEGMRGRLGLADFPTVAGLGEAEMRDVTAALDLDRLGDYLDTVHAGIQTWVESAPEAAFSAEADGPAGLERAGMDEDDVPWLYRLWSGQPASFFLQWEAIGHRINHVGEMVSVRNRLGLSPF